MKTVKQDGNVFYITNHRNFILRFFGLKPIVKLYHTEWNTFKYFGGNYCFHEESGKIVSPTSNTHKLLMNSLHAYKQQ